MQITPSLMALFATGILLLSILIILFSNKNNFLALDYINQIILLSLLCISIGIHGLLHLGVEINYNFNPLLLI